ncbi:MAG TPA: Holliday junction resolvase RuvX [Planctomycetaceae bacterium]|nr:Holliday junction resolvase RuvX [Planctomycetaceae bacterium]
MTNTSEPSAEDFPSEGALLAIDYGTKRLGFAVCDRDQRIAFPVENYQRGNDQQDLQIVRRLIEEYRILGLIVGLPVHMSGDEGEKAQSARAFGEWAAEATDLPIRFWDERFSSQQADEMLDAGEFSKHQRRGRRDMLSAHAILQNYLDSPDRTAAPRDLREQ